MRHNLAQSLYHTVLVHKGIRLAVTLVFWVVIIVLLSNLPCPATFPQSSCNVCVAEPNDVFINRNGLLHFLNECRPKHGSRSLIWGNHGAVQVQLNVTSPPTGSAPHCTSWPTYLHSRCRCFMHTVLCWNWNTAPCCSLCLLCTFEGPHLNEP